MSPFLIFYFLLRFAALILEKSTKQYREELNNLMSKTIQQLKKIQMLAKNNPEFEFIDNEKLIDIENALLHGNSNNKGEELFRNTKTYTNEQQNAEVFSSKSEKYVPCTILGNYINTCIRLSFIQYFM